MTGRERVFLMIFSKFLAALETILNCQVHWICYCCIIKNALDLFEQFYSIYAQQFEVNLDSPRLGYFTQSAVVKNLCEAVNTTPEDANLLTLFVGYIGHQ